MRSTQLQKACRLVNWATGYIYKGVQLEPDPYGYEEGDFHISLDSKEAISQANKALKSVRDSIAKDYQAYKIKTLNARAHTKDVSKCIDNLLVPHPPK